MKSTFASLPLIVGMGLALLVTTPDLEARADSRGEDRLYNSYLVMKEALGMRSRIPRSLLEKAYCVIVIPSVLKGAVGFGGSYGRGNELPGR